jgi:hypothetical protein
MHTQTTNDTAQDTGAEANKSDEGELTPKADTAPEVRLDAFKRLQTGLKAGRPPLCW